MPATNWSKLNRQQLGAYAEYWAKLEFVSYGFHVYTSEIDDHGVDFVTESPAGELFCVQVKSVRGDNYTFIRKDKIVFDDRHLVCYMRFEEGAMPEVFVFPASVWNSPNELFVDRNYNSQGQKSKPEYGIQYSAKNRHLLEGYEAEVFLLELAGNSDKLD